MSPSQILKAESCPQHSLRFRLGKGVSFSFQILATPVGALLPQLAQSMLQELSCSMPAPLTADSLCMDLAAVHMTLLQIAEDASKQQRRHVGKLSG